MRHWLLLPASTLLLAGFAHADTKSDKLAKIFDQETIGADVAWLENITGPARNTYGKTKIYKVDGCEITATTVKGTIDALRMEITPTCTFDLAAVLPRFEGKLPPLEKLTFGAFDALTPGAGRFYADCLDQCGNAADPVVIEHWSGGRPDRVIEVMLEVAQVSDATLAAADAWRKAMREGESKDWVIKRQFNCSNKYDELAHKVFRDIPITAITVGWQLEPPACGES